jgi:thymidine kinase
MEAMLWTAAVHDRSGFGIIDSRIGITAQANAYEPGTDLRREVEAELGKRPVHCILVDEAQFLSRGPGAPARVDLRRVRHPVLAYGLRTDFQANLFEGSATLLALADKLVELKAICECGRKATMNLRVGEGGRAVASGAQTEIGGNDRYVALCRRHFMERIGEAEAKQLRLSLVGG